MHRLQVPVSPTLWDLILPTELPTDSPNARLSAQRDSNTMEANHLDPNAALPLQPLEPIQVTLERYVKPKGYNQWRDLADHLYWPDARPIGEASPKLSAAVACAEDISLEQAEALFPGSTAVSFALQALCHGSYAVLGEAGQLVKVSKHRAMVSVWNATDGEWSSIKLL